MDWEALVQILWDVTRHHGRKPLEAHVRSAMADQPCDALVLALELLQADGKKDAFEALLRESLTNCVPSGHSKHRLQLSLAFKIPLSNTLTPMKNRSDFLDEVHELVVAKRFTEAVSKIIGALEANQDNSMLELLGRITILQQTYEASLPSIAEPSNVDKNKHASVDTSELETSFNLFVWHDSDTHSSYVHDDGCIASATAQQDLISRTVPAEPTAIEWDINLEDSTEPTPWRSSTTPPSELAISNPILHTGNADAMEAESNIEKAINLEEVAREARKSYLDQQVIRLQPADKKLLGIILANPKISLDQLCRLTTTRASVVNQILGTRLVYWIERDRLGGFSIKQDLVKLIAEELCDIKALFQERYISVTPINPAAHQPNEAGKDDTNGSTDLSAQAQAVLDFFSRQPGTKTYKAAEALGLDHVALLSLLSGKLDDYLEKDRNFLVFPRAKPITPQLQGKVIERSQPISETNAVQMLSEGEATKIRQRIEHTASQVRHLASMPNHGDADTDYTLKDLEKAAALSRLPLLGKNILALLASTGKSYSRDIARDLGHDVDDVNKMLLNKLNEHVYVTHSVWRLSDGVIEALKFAAII